MNNRIGYACINMTLSQPPKRSGIERITTNRTARKATWDKLGTEYLGELALQNANDLIKILKWNEEHDIRFFRISSDIIPFADKFDLNDLPQLDAIKDALLKAGTYARKHNHRITTHPGPFHILGSNKQRVVDDSIIGLERHSEIFDMMGYEPSFENKINIHIGTVSEGKDIISKRWISNYNKLSESCKARLVIENDDKKSMYSVLDLYELFHTKINIPITFDYWHHNFCTGGLSTEEALRLAHSTWPKHIKPVVHYSESRRHEGIKNGIENAEKIREQAHADYVYNNIDTFGLEVDIMLEAKQKELAVLRHRQLIEENYK